MDSHRFEPIAAVVRLTQRHAAVWLACLTMLCAAALLIALPAHANPGIPHIVVDRETGSVIAANRPFERWHPASLTKLMTVYVTLKAIRAGEIQNGSPVTISALAAGQRGSRMGYARGTQLRIDAATKLVAVKSANDVAIALAEAVAGSEQAFVDRMNAEAARLGMTDSNFVNPHGWHASDQFVSARDMALLTRQLLVEFPQWSAVFAAPALKTGDKLHYSYNLLLERFDGADGIKTGFVCASGYNFVASATRGGRQLIAVVLGAFSQTERAVESARLLTEGFATDIGSVAPRGINVFYRSGPVIGPTDQRSRMCTERARQSRYDPGAGQAVIDSPALLPRTRRDDFISVETGGIDAPPSEAFLLAGLIPSGRVPVPARRPDYSRRDIDGQPLTGPSVPANLAPGAVPVPVFRPRP